MRWVSIAAATFVLLIVGCTSSVNTDSPVVAEAPLDTQNCDTFPERSNFDSHVVDSEGCWVDPYIAYHNPEKGNCSPSDAQSLLLGMPIGTSWKANIPNDDSRIEREFAFDYGGDKLIGGPFGDVITHDELPDGASGIEWFVGDREIWTATAPPDVIYLVGSKDVQVWTRYTVVFGCVAD